MTTKLRPREDHYTSTVSGANAGEDYDDEDDYGNRYEDLDGEDPDGPCCRDFSCPCGG